MHPKELMDLYLDFLVAGKTECYNETRLLCKVERKKLADEIKRLGKEIEQIDAKINNKPKW
jgi:hypothetical protein